MILDKAREVGACVISDEAYGDYLAPEDSAITLVNEYDNLIVMRSFSKGTGLAGMRAAYVAASPESLRRSIRSATLTASMASGGVWRLPRWRTRHL